jgi:GH15 family glucan-1,4-alpha-glucosidase
MDVLGEVMSALEHARDAGVDDPQVSWRLQRVLVEDMCEHWDEPDNGIWEVRGPRRHFTHSRVMVWVALNSAISAVEEHHLSGGDLDHWRDLRQQVRDEILTKGYDDQRGTFVQHYDTEEVDAALLLIPLVGFLPGDDPRVLGTIAAVEADLMRDGLLMRYRTEATADGVPGDEQAFLACSFWLVSAYALAGRDRDARRLMDRLVGLVNDVGLLSEEYDPREQRMTGNFPQAFSHLALVNAAMRLDGDSDQRR